MSPASTAAQDTTLRISRTLNAPPERVFAAFASPEAMKEWFSPAPVTVQAVEQDFRVGGAYVVHMRLPDGKVRPVGGTYREIEPNTRLVYTWRWQDSPNFPETTVSLDFRRTADGKTELAMVHEGLPDESSRDHHTKGWTGCLERLEGYLG
ncbi:MAG: Activator of Hsp90 ATPase 1 family protein [Gemmatimonadetes bacterium]|nr:Activator of Hsp90 ATPase 1 family protein [Gemmatimonadota bacterium]